MSVAYANDPQDCTPPPSEGPLRPGEGEIKVIHALQRHTGVSVEEQLDDMLRALRPLMAEPVDSFILSTPGAPEHPVSLQDAFRRSAAPRAGGAHELTLYPAQKENLRHVHEFLKRNNILQPASTLADAFRCAVHAAGEIMLPLYEKPGSTLCVRGMGGKLIPRLGVAPPGDF
jgi:hypothetical protein